jgi:hypothetical protein
MWIQIRIYKTDFFSILDDDDDLSSVAYLMNFFPMLKWKKKHYSILFLDDVAGALLMDIPAAYCTLNRQALRFIFNRFLLKGFFYLRDTQGTAWINHLALHNHLTTA